MNAMANRRRGLISHASRNILVSFALFVIAYLVLGALSLQNAYLSIICPLISTAMILVCPKAQCIPDGTASQQEIPPEKAVQHDVPQHVSQPDPRTDSVAHLQDENDGNPPNMASTQNTNIAESPDASFGTNVPLATAPMGGTAGDTRIASFARMYGLSERETELTSFAYRNYSAKRIAAELYIAESTVYTHLKRIYRKTDVHSKQELIDLIDHFDDSRR